ncbi:MAG: sigma-70 family RNA polymerase sigma factor [Ferruginibacter sp.]|nr:sigma-70 family RNA polymerase sigma factor [Cytophagales bacterium]
MNTAAIPTVDRLRIQDRAAYELLYRLVMPSVVRLVRRNGGNVADAEDVFQETLMVLFEKVQRPDFRLTASLKTYLITIARNIWLNRLRARRTLLLNNLADCDNLPDQPADEFTPTNAVLRWLDQATPFCRALLRAVFFDNEPMETLLARMGWKNKHTAANQKYKCVQQVKRVAVGTNRAHFFSRSGD